jgi:hypothetical protein
MRNLTPNQYLPSPPAIAVLLPLAWGPAQHQQERA